MRSLYLAYMIRPMTMTLRLMAQACFSKYMILFFVIGFTYGCNLLSIHNEDDKVKLETNRDSYMADSDTVIQMTVTNNYDNAIYYICTGQVSLEELAVGMVIDSWLVHGFEQCLHRNPVKVNQSVTFEIPFESSLSPGRLKNGRFDESVDYRLRMDLYETEEVKQLIDKEDRLSNRFKILRE